MMDTHSEIYISTIAWIATSTAVLQAMKDNMKAKSEFNDILRDINTHKERGEAFVNSIISKR